MLAEDLDLPLSTFGLPSPGPVRPLGEILADRVDLPPPRVREILAHAREHDTRFGDAAVALGYATPEDVLIALSQQFQYPCATDGDWAEHPELVVLSRPYSTQAEAVRALRGHVARRLAHAGPQRPALAVVSPDPGDGKTFFAANLAIALAQAGSRTLLVDADMRGPRLQELFDLRGRFGLSSVLLGRPDTQPVHAVRGVPGLFVMPCGVAPPNPLELIERSAFRTLMERLPQHFDHVIVDTPALAYGADALAIADRCGASLMLGRRDRSRMPALREMADALDADGPRLLGLVYNDF